MNKFYELSFTNYLRNNEDIGWKIEKMFAQSWSMLEKE